MPSEREAPRTPPQKRKHRVERVMRKMEPLLIENTKKVLILKGKKTSQTVTDILRDVV